jgi:hypothetical protein
MLRTCRRPLRHPLAAAPAMAPGLQRGNQARPLAQKVVPRQPIASPPRNNHLLLRPPPRQESWRRGLRWSPLKSPRRLPPKLPLPSKKNQRYPPPRLLKLLPRLLPRPGRKLRATPACPKTDRAHSQFTSPCPAPMGGWSSRSLTWGKGTLLWSSTGPSGECTAGRSSWS